MLVTSVRSKEPSQESPKAQERMRKRGALASWGSRCASCMCRDGRRAALVHLSLRKLEERGVSRRSRKGPILEVGVREFKVSTISDVP